MTKFRSVFGLFLILSIVGCATTKRFLTEEDKAMGEMCRAEACVVLPESVLEQLLKLIESKRV